MQHEAKPSAALASRPTPNTINSRTVVWWYSNCFIVMICYVNSSITSNCSIISTRALHGNYRTGSAFDLVWLYTIKYNC